MRLIKPITIKIDEELWISFKEKVPRTIKLNDQVVELIKKYCDLVEGIKR